MTKNFVKVGAMFGAASLAMLAAGPAVGASHISQATAQSLQLSIAGTSAVSQQVSAVNDGKGQKTVENSTLPTIASVLPANSLIGAGVAPQLAGATVAAADGKGVKKGDGLSFACAGIAGTGGGVVTVGDSGCKINGKPLTIDLAHLDLGNVLLGNNSALGSALNNIPGLGAALQQVVTALNTQVVQAISKNLASTPLGDITIGGSLSAIEGICTANPSGAQGTANIVDSSGGSADTPIGVTLPTMKNKPITLLNLPANPPPNTHVLVNLDKVTATLITGIKQELNTAVQGALQPLAGPLGGALDQVQNQVVTTLVSNLQPALVPLQQNILDITLNKQSKGNNGKSIDVTALDLQVLPAAKQFAGGSLISGGIGHVTCGPNGKVVAPVKPSPTVKPTPTKTPNVPNNVDSGLASYQGGSDANAWIAAIAALLALGGGAGTLAYRRYWMPRG